MMTFITLLISFSLGRSFCVTSQRALTASLEQLVSRMHIGVMIKFEKIGPEPAMIIPNDDEIVDLNNRNWTTTRNLIYVRSGQKGYSVGHWPIPEAYWPDLGISSLQPRSAHPIIKFACTNSEPAVIDNLPFDKYELDPSPLTHFILSRKQPNVAWQVFVANSQRNSEIGQPFGYLKASTNLTCVNLFVLPYNYPVLLPLLDELFKIHQGKPTREWRQLFDNYLKSMPIYYATPLRRALQRMGANNSNLVPENLDVYTTVTLNNLIKKNKNLAKMEFEKLAASVGSQKPIGFEWPRISISNTQMTANSNFNRKSNMLEYCCNPSLKKVFSSLQNEHLDFNGFVVRFKDKPNSESKAHCYRNPFDISRHDLIDQVYKLRRNFFQKQTSLIKYQDEDQLHSLPVSQMGNYQEYLKRLPIPLREIEALPTRQHMFGNPFKLDKKNVMMIDEADIDLVGNGGGNSGRGKRPVSDPYNIGGPKPKRKPGPLPKDFPYSRPLTPPPSPPVIGPSQYVATSSPNPPFTAPLPYPHQNAPYPPYHLNNTIFQNTQSTTSFKTSQPNGHFNKLSKIVATQYQNSNIVGSLQSNCKPFEASDLSMVPNSNNQSVINHISSNDIANIPKTNRQQVFSNNLVKKQLPLTNGILTSKSVLLSQVYPDQNGGDDLSCYLLNSYRRKNFTRDEYEKKTNAMQLVRRSNNGKPGNHVEKMSVNNVLFFV